MKGAWTAPANARRINGVPRSGAMETQRPAPSASAEMEPSMAGGGTGGGPGGSWRVPRWRAGAVCAEPLAG